MKSEYGLDCVLDQIKQLFTLHKEISPNFTVN